MSSNKKNKPVVYSAMEVANICGVVNQTAINWIRNEYLKAFKTPGGQYRVYPEDLVDFMQSRQMHVPLELLDNCATKSLRQEKTVLIVDDDRNWNGVVSKFIQSRNEDIVIYNAYDGFSAGYQIMEKKPKVVVLDLDLPGINGVKICETIYNSPALGRPVVIVTTALDDDGVENECRSLGVEHYFRKPITLSVLYESIESSLYS